MCRTSCSSARTAARRRASGIRCSKTANAIAPARSAARLSRSNDQQPRGEALECRAAACGVKLLKAHPGASGARIEMAARLKDRYKSEILPALIKEFNYANPMAA